MRKHVDFLGILLLGWSAFSLLVGCATLLIAAGAAAIVGGAGVDENVGVAAGITAAFFSTIGLLALVWGAVHAGAGFGVRRYRHWSRPLALALGVVNLILLPFGTALGVYALWVLLAAETRQMFQSASASGLQGGSTVP